MAAQPQYTYQPQPNELPYYNALFTTADKSSSGHLSGAVAVEFLSLSKLPVDLLKQIWTMADQPPSNTLDMNKFYAAVRLIQLFQNGKKPIDLALNIAEGEPPMRPPFFEGVNVQAIMQQGSGASVAPRPPMQQQLSSQQLGGPPPQQVVQQPTPQGSPQRSPQLNGMSAQQPPAMSQPATMNGAPPTMSPNNQQQQQLAIQDPYTMAPQELARYEQLFPTYAAQEADGMYYVHGGAAVELFSKSGMPNEQLKSIWSMSDSPIDNKLDSIEFAIAMHLIVCVTKKGLSMPPSLPPSLAMLMNDARGGGSGGGTVVGGVGGQSVAAVPPSPGGIPSPDKMGGMMHQQQQPQMMNGGLAPPPQQMGMAQQPPAAQMGMQQQPQQPHTIQQSNSFGVSPEGGTVDDAFAGLSNESVNVEEYSVAGDMSAAGGDASGFGGQAAMSTLGGVVQHQQPVMPIQEVATPEPSPMPVKPTMQQTVMPPPPIQQTQQQQTHALPPRSPRSTPRTTAPSSEDSSAELVSLREAHQKLQAEVISLRAKAASVSEEEQETQKEIAQLASEIGKLSMELSELKENVMDAKVKLGESVGILKVQLEKKGSLEVQVEEARITHEALTSANTAVEEANEMAMAQRAQSVAAAAMAKEEASVVVPEPAPQQPVETADLFSWGAPAPAAPEANSVAMQPPVEPASVASEISPVLTATMPPPSDVDRDSFSVYSTSGGVNANPNPYGQPLGVAPPQQQQPMGGGIPEPTNQGFDYNQQQQQSQQAGISPMGPGMSLGGGGIPEPMGYQQPPAQPQLTPPRQQESFASYNSAPAPSQQAAVPSGPPSPTKAELEEVKGKTVEAEQTFRKQADLVRSISNEVVQLESVAKQAEANMTLLEGKTKKGSFVGGKKKKAKKEYEKAMEVAEAERKKVENAKAQLAAAEREAQNAKGNVDSLRSKYEEMEMQAATAASYMDAQQQTYGDNQSVVSAQLSMASAQPTVASVQPAYNDPFGGMNMGQPPAQPTNDLYGAPMGGGGDYANPFL